MMLKKAAAHKAVLLVEETPGIGINRQNAEDGDRPSQEDWPSVSPAKSIPKVQSISISCGNAE